MSGECNGCGAEGGECHCPSQPGPYSDKSTKHPVVAQHQPDPVKNDWPAIQDLVLADIEARKRVGLERYGTLLQPFNGRDALMDAYQEILDAAVYMRQLLFERDGQ